MTLTLLVISNKMPPVQQVRELYLLPTNLVCLTQGVKLKKKKTEKLSFERIPHNPLRKHSLVMCRYP